jgi:beta-galactosidase
MEKILADAVKKAGLWGTEQQLYFPLITKQGVNEQGKKVRYLFNYSAQATTVKYPFANGKELLRGEAIKRNSTLALEPWDLKIIEEQ